jgi:hypothetical protein
MERGPTPHLIVSRAAVRSERGYGGGGSSSSGHKGEAVVADLADVAQPSDNSSLDFLHSPVIEIFTSCVLFVVDFPSQQT